jgi:hypothetical protein
MACVILTKKLVVIDVASILQLTSRSFGVRARSLRSRLVWRIVLLVIRSKQVVYQKECGTAAFYYQSCSY